MNTWYFRPRTEGETKQERVAGEFFGPIDQEPGRALVREGIQNALDATPSGEKTSVRIAMVDGNDSIDLGSAWTIFDGLGSHLEAASETSNTLTNNENICPYLLFEDFGFGLEGDPADGFGEDPDNHFFHFFRAEGKSDKKETDRGSWGVGKVIFTRTSQINTMFGFTKRRSDEKELLMGKSILEYHKLEGDYYQEGYFGRIKDPNNQDLVMPVEHKDTLAEFSDLFDLGLGEDGSGLSVVVPFPREDIDKEALLKSVIEEYFYPILKGKLEVMVELPSIQTILDCDKLLEEAYEIDAQLEGRLGPGTIDALELAKWSGRVPEEEKFETKMPDPHRRWQWSRELITEEDLHSLKDRFRDNKKIAVRVPVTVRPEDGDFEKSFFDVYLKNNPDSKEQPFFVRDEIIIPNVQSPLTRGVTALVVASDDPVSEFLRSAENPAHTDWQKGISKFKNRYVSGISDLGFVKKSVHRIVKYITSSDDKADPTLLVDFFSIPSDLDQHEKQTESTTDNHPGNEGDQSTPKPPPPDKRYRISGLSEGGFSVTSVNVEDNLPLDLNIYVAYDVRRGNPLKNYDQADFLLSDDSIKLESKGLSIITVDKNLITVEVIDREFSLKTTGFDSNRDLYVLVKESEGNNGNTAS